MSERKSNLINVSLFDLYILLGGSPDKSVTISRKWYEEERERQAEIRSLAKEIRGTGEKDLDKPVAPAVEELSEPSSDIDPWKNRDKDKKDLDNSSGPVDDETPTRDKPIASFGSVPLDD